MSSYTAQDLRWPDNWFSNFLVKAMNIQEIALADVPEEKKAQGYGRAAQLIIDGCGIYEIAFTKRGLVPKPEDIEIKNAIYASEETMLDLITPDIDVDDLQRMIKAKGMDYALSRLHPRLNFRAAIANHLITFDGERPDVDSEEWSQIIDRFLNKIAFPFVVRSLVKHA